MTGKPISAEDGPFLLRSHYHASWHCRSETGGAAGYTSDIMRAGVFDFETARAYHEPAGTPHRRNEAITAKEAIADLEARLALMDAERADFAKKVEAMRSALSAADLKESR